MFMPSPEPTDEMRSHQTKLYVVFGVYLILGFLKLTGNPSFAISEIIASLLFLCGIVGLNYCMVVFFMVLVLFTMFQYMMYFGLVVQHYIYKGTSPMSQGGMALFFFIVVAISFVFNIFAEMICFDAYKCFKWEALKGVAEPSPSAPLNNDLESKKHTPFQGKGTPIGSN